jgi:heat shock protein HslJ
MPVLNFFTSQTANGGGNFVSGVTNSATVTGSFTGYTGCNNITGRFISNGGNSISFQNPTPSTRLECQGGLNEEAFISALRRANSYAVNNYQLQLMEGSNVLLVFSKNSSSR